MSAELVRYVNTFIFSKTLIVQYRRLDDHTKRGPRFRLESRCRCHLTAMLLIKKQRPEHQRGRYNGIGGKIEPGETPSQAAVREIHEEVAHYQV